MQSDYLRINEAAELCLISERRIRVAIEEGELPIELFPDRDGPAKTGRRLVTHIRKDCLERWREEREKAPPAHPADLLTIREAVKLFSISERRLRVALINGELEFQLLPDKDRRLGSGSKPIKHIRIAELERWLGRPAPSA